jgi:RNA polymerase sigma-70 factor (ECF subfamily)
MMTPDERPALNPTASTGALEALLQGSLRGDAAVTRQLVEKLTPVVHVRVARALLRSPEARRQGRDLRQETEDLVQEIFSALFADRARALRGWDSTRGLSLANFVGMIAEHQVASILRRGRRSPWKEEATTADSLDRSAGSSEGAHGRVYSREVLTQLLARLRVELSPRGYELFEKLVVEDKSVEAVCQETALSADAVYAWRSRLGKQARKIYDEITRDAPSSGRLRTV